MVQAEISLCRVYKRAGVEDHPSLPRSLPTSSRASSSSSRNSQPPPRRFQPNTKINDVVTTTSSCSTTEIIPLSNDHMVNNSYTINPMPPSTSLLVTNHDHNFDHSNKMATFPHSKHAANCNSSLPPNCTITSHANIDDLHRLVMNFNYPQQQYQSLPNNIAINHEIIDPPPNLASHFPTLPPQPQPQPAAGALNVGPFPAAFSDRLWEWNAISEANKDFTNPFK